MDTRPRHSRVSRAGGQEVGKNCPCLATSLGRTEILTATIRNKSSTKKKWASSLSVFQECPKKVIETAHIVAECDITATTAMLPTCRHPLSLLRSGTLSIRSCGHPSHAVNTFRKANGPFQLPILKV